MPRTPADAPSIMPQPAISSVGFERVFGVPPNGTNAFSVLKKGPGQKFVIQDYPDGEGTRIKRFPLGELSPPWLRERFGHGEFSIFWWEHDPDGNAPADRWVARGKSPPFFLEPTRPIAAPPVPSLEPAAPEGFGQALQLMDLIDRRATTQLTGMAQLAQVMMGQQQRGTDPALLALLQEQQRQGTAMAAQIASIQRSLDEPEEEDSAGGAGAAVASAATQAIMPRIKPGQPISEHLWASVGNYFTQNPDKLVDLVKLVPAALEKLGGPAKKQRTVIQAAPPPPIIIQQVAAPEPMPQTPKPRPPAGPGLNAIADSQPKVAKEPPAAPTNGAAS